MSVEPAPGPPVPDRPGRSPASGAVKLLREHWRTLVPIALVGAVPVALVDAVDFARSGVDPFLGARDPQAGERTTLSWVSVGLSLALYSLVSAACIHAVSEALAGRPRDWRAALGWGAGRTVPVLLATLLVTVGVTLGLLALIVPGIWLAVSWSVASPVVVLENASPVAALKRSFGLVRGSWWYSLGMLLLGMAFAFAALVAVAIPVAVVLSGVSGDVARVLVYAAVEAVLMAVLLPFAAALLTLLYFELRERREPTARAYPSWPEGDEHFGGFEPPAPPR